MLPEGRGPIDGIGQLLSIQRGQGDRASRYFAAAEDIETDLGGGGQLLADGVQGLLGDPHAGAAVHPFLHRARGVQGDDHIVLVQGLFVHGVSMAEQGADHQEADMFHRNSLSGGMCDQSERTTGRPRIRSRSRTH